MTIKVSIRNDEPEGGGHLALTVVTVGDLRAEESKQVLAPQQSTVVDVHPGQFVMVDETEQE